MSNATLTRGRSLTCAGISIIPTNISDKRPAFEVLPAGPDGKPSWDVFNEDIATADEVDTWFADGSRAVAVINGAVSGNLETVDFDQPDGYPADTSNRTCQAFLAAAELMFPGIGQRLSVTKTRKGYHVRWRCLGPVGGNQKLAEVPKLDADGKPETDRRGRPRKATLVETRGEHGYAVCDPSPGYSHFAGPAIEDAARITSEERIGLLTIASSFDRMPTDDEQPVENVPQAGMQRQADDIRPGDDFNARGEWEPLLQELGLREVYRGSDGVVHLQRIGSTNPVSATIGYGGKDKLTNFSTNVDLPTGQAMSKYAVYASLYHDDDFSKAASALRSEGYGSQPKNDHPGLKSVNGVPISIYRDPDATEADAGPEDDADDLPPDDLITVTADPGPIPDDLLYPHGFIGQMASWILRTSHRPQPEFALASAIATFSTLVGRKVRDRTNCRTNVYFGCVGETGCGKERPREASKDLLSEVGMVRHLTEGFRSGAAVLSALQRDPVCLGLWDEMGAGLESIRNSKQAHWLAEIINNFLKVYTSAGTTFVGENYADADKQQHIIQPHLSLLGSTTETTLFNALSEYLITNGFINRTLFWWARPDVRIANVRYERCPVELVDVATYWRDYQPGGNLAARTDDSPPVPDFIDYDHDAQTLLESYVIQCDDRRAGMRHEWERALRIRQVEQVRRLAMLHGISIDREYRMIGFESVDWAIKIVDHCTDRLIWHASTRIAENEYAGEMLKVLAFIRGSGSAGVTQDEVARRFRGIKAQPRRDLLAHLMEAGDIVTAEVKTKGRPKHIYRVRTEPETFRREESPFREESREESFRRNPQTDKGSGK